MQFDPRHYCGVCKQLVKRDARHHDGQIYHPSCLRRRLQRSNKKGRPVVKQFALSLILLCSCGSPFSGIDDGTVEGGDDAAPDVAPDAPAPSEAATDVLPPDVDPQDADAGMATDAPPDVPSEACVSGLWCAIEDGGSFTPCGAGNFTCGGNACDPMHCTEGGPCRILTGMGPDGSIYEDGKVTRCAP